MERLVAQSMPSRHATPFSVGDRVKVVLEVDALKGMQEGHGGWNPRMAEVRCAERNIIFMFPLNVRLYGMFNFIVYW